MSSLMVLSTLSFVYLILLNLILFVLGKIKKPLQLNNFRKLKWIQHTSLIQQNFFSILTYSSVIILPLPNCSFSITQTVYSLSSFWLFLPRLYHLLGCLLVDFMIEIILFSKVYYILMIPSSPHNIPVSVFLVLFPVTKLIFYNQGSMNLGWGLNDKQLY